MSVAALGDIGRVESGPIAPVNSVRPVGTGRTILVRPAAGSEPIESRPTEPKRPTRAGTSEGPRRDTAHQSNADGDSATFSSKLNALTEPERAELSRLRDRDSEVRTHEQAHLASAGGLAAGGPSYEYKTGPDGEKYAVGGHVSIDTSPGATPQETIARAQRMKQAALAPANPSGQDRAVAAKAMRMESEARRELAKGGTSVSAAAGGASASPNNSSNGGSLDLVA